MGAAHYSAALLPCRSSPSCLTPDSCRLFNSTMSLTLLCFFLAPGTPTRLALDLAGPEQLRFTEVVRKYRRWLGWSEPRIICLPAWVAGALYRLGDVAGRLGWRPPLRSTARREVVRGAVGDPREWSRLTGIAPQSLSAALASEPASVHERWFAAVYLLKPVLFSVLFAFWISGLLSIGPGYQFGVALMPAPIAFSRRCVKPRSADRKMFLA